MGTQIKKLKKIATGREQLEKILKTNSENLNPQLNLAENIEKLEKEKLELRRKTRNKRKNKK